MERRSSGSVPGRRERGRVLEVLMIVQSERDVVKSRGNRSEWVKMGAGSGSVDGSAVDGIDNSAVE